MVVDPGWRACCRKVTAPAAPASASEEKQIERWRRMLTIGERAPKSSPSSLSGDLTEEPEGDGKQGKAVVELRGLGGVLKNG